MRRSVGPRAVRLVAARHRGKRCLDEMATALDAILGADVAERGARAGARLDPDKRGRASALVPECAGVAVDAARPVTTGRGQARAKTGGEAVGEVEHGGVSRSWWSAMLR